MRCASPKLQRRRRWERKAIPITLLLTFLIQVGANLISGHGPLDTGENFTAYITFYGMNWWRIPADAYTFSTVAQFIKDPAGFIRLFIPLFLNLIVYGIPSLLCVLFLRDVREKKYAWFVLLATLLYSMAVAIGTSATSRGPFPVLGMTISCGGLLVMELASRGRSLVRSSKPVSIAVILSMVMAVLWSFGSWLQTDWRFLTVYRAQNQAFRQVEKKLISLGMTTPTEAFTNKLGLYFPGTPPFRPYSNGGWENYSTWGYREEYPEMPINSWEDFVEACSAQRIKFLVLSPGAGLVSDYLGSLYNGQFHPEEVQLIAKIGKTKIFELKNN